jgi:glycine dehydrogenase subunit 1
MTYIGNTDDDRRIMLERLGISSVEDLFQDVPEAHRFPQIDLPPARTEIEILQEIDALARQNSAGTDTLSFIGAGAYQHFIPSVVSYLAGRGEFTTAYTPYQAEASQGTVQTIFEYQSMVADLLGMDVVNASHYDGSTAVAEAAIMAVRSTRGKDRVALSGTLHPEYLQVAATYLKPQGVGMTVVNRPTASGSAGPTREELLAAVDDRTACLIVQNPDFLGRLHDLSGLAEEVHARGALLVIHVDPIATALFQSPGSLGADIVTGEGQPLGIPVSYGGPYLGLFAAKEKLVRKMPGRLAGETQDAHGRRGYVLTLNTREQHIRRDKATSNICTNQGLMALRAAIYLSSMGPQGLKEVANLSYQKAHYAAGLLAEIPGCQVNASGSAPFFKEFVLSTPVPAAQVLKAAKERGVIAGFPLATYYPQRQNELLIAVTEPYTRSQIEQLASAVHAAVAATTATREEAR